MNGFALDFEKPIIDMERKIEELKKVSEDGNIDVSKELEQLKKKTLQLKKDVYGNLTSWQRVQIARHPSRPYTLDYIKLIMEDFVELHGDRFFSDDKALIGGVARFMGEPVMIIGHQKGRDTKENLKRNFGSAHPEGYRKALRLMHLAERFKIPVFCFIDTPGAYPGVGAEERGQAEAIAFNLQEMMGLKTQIMVVVIGEGGSGGALGIGIGDKVFMLENSYYSVISPEGCSAILWKDPKKTQTAAEALKLTAQDLIKFNLIDEILPEPLGGAHKNVELMAMTLRDNLADSLQTLKEKKIEALLEMRYQKFRKMGVYFEGGIAPYGKEKSQPENPVEKNVESGKKKVAEALASTQ